MDIEFFNCVEVSILPTSGPTNPLPSPGTPTPRPSLRPVGGGGSGSKCGCSSCSASVLERNADGYVKI